MFGAVVTGLVYCSLEECRMAQRGDGIKREKNRSNVLLRIRVGIILPSDFGFDLLRRIRQLSIADSFRLTQEQPVLSCVMDMDAGCLSDYAKRADMTG